ncbi:MAG: hypothetical protein HN726_03245 [Candidatus Magasanikbacteria bacterium]|nr:hypothetical protein [Candidatus Magasanikbacteria bacterium]
MILFIARACGILGLLLITWGIFIKKEKRQDLIFIFGGLGLLFYSISLKDPIFITLQIVFIFASLYELAILNKRKR